MAVANGGFPFTQRDVVTEIYGDSSNRSLTELFSAAIGTFDTAYVGSKNSLYNFRNYQHTQPNGGYGRLYNGYVIADSRNIAPSGWHVPTPAEIVTLTEYINNSINSNLKESGTAHWETADSLTTNVYEFSAVGGGQRYNHNGDFYGIKSFGYLWTSNYSGSNPCWGFNIYSSSFANAVGGYGIGIKSGFPLRLIKDDSNNTGIMTDNSGYTYKTVKIGNQVWMASNLRGTKYRNGDTIPTVTDNTAWMNLSTGACCSYANNDAYSYADNYILPGTTIKIEIRNNSDGTNHYLYAQAIDTSTWSPITVNTNVTVYFTYAYYDYTSKTTISKKADPIIMSGNNKTPNIAIGGPFVSCTATFVSPTNYNSYTYII